MGLFSKYPTVHLLVVGLGNPGADYAQSRHNAGFLALDVLLDRANTNYTKLRCNALVGEGKLGDNDVALALAKPQTYMNRSGQAVKGLLAHYKLTAQDLIVIHDDLDIPEHTLRLKSAGGHGGHNGLRDINSSIGDDYRRIRIGIGRPPGKMPTDRYVLQRLSSDALEQLHVDAQLAAEAVVQIVNQGFSATQNTINAT